MALISGTDLATYLQITYSSGDTALAQAVTLACGLVTGYTGQGIESTTYTHTLLINSDQTIRLPQRPVTAVTSVTIDGTVLTSGTDYDWDGLSYMIALDGYTPADDVFTASVVYVAGYASVPADVKAATLSVGAALYNGAPGVTSESIDDYRVSYETSRGAGGLNEYERSILKRYRVRLGNIAPVSAKAGREGAYAGTDYAGWRRS